MWQILLRIGFAIRCFNLMNKHRSNSSTKKKLNSLWLFICLFFFATIIHPVVAEVSAPAPIVQTQTNPSQLVREAKELYQAQQYQEALPLWHTAAAEYEKSGDNLNRAIALGNLSLTHQQLGQWEDAGSAIASSLDLLKSEPGNSMVLAQTLDIKGKLQRETGKSTEAIDTWQAAAKIYQQQNNLTAIEQNNLNQAQALQDLGLYPRACKRILHTLSLKGVNTCKQLNQLNENELASKLQSSFFKPSPAKVLALRNLADLLIIIGQPLQSEQILTASLTSIEKIDTEKATTYLSLGNTYRVLAQGEEIATKRRQYEKQVIESYSQADSLAQSPTTKLKAQLNQLDFLIYKEKWTEAEPLWRSLYPQVTDVNLSNNRDHLYARINYGKNLVELVALQDPAIAAPSNQEIEDVFLGAADLAQTLGDKRIEAYAWGGLGRLNEINQEYSIAQEYTQQALNLISSYDAADIAYQYFWQLGRIEKAQNNITRAIASYTKAYNALQSLRRDIATINPEVQFNFRDEVEPVYRELVELDLADAAILEANNDLTTTQTRLVQAREVIESLQLAQLNNFFQEACVESQPQLLDQITDKNDLESAIVYPIVLQDRFEIILKLPKQPLRRYSKPFDDFERVQRILTRLNLTLTQFNSRETLPLAQQVYDWIIEPIASDIEQEKIKTLVFVLDNPLQNIPMAVLHDGQNYLVEKYSLALTPGLQLLDPKPLTKVKLNAVVGGLSEVRKDFAPHSQFGNLPKVTEELQTIKNVGVSENSLLNKGFTKEALKREIINSDFPIVHLATHAQFSSKAEDTFILSWDGQINIRDLDDLLQDNTFTRRNDIELLVMSACETASGDPRATLGLAGVAVQAGARSTLATLWSVVDESTAQLMGEFYNQLQQARTTNASKAEVLRQAQISLIQDERFNNPHFWAPFILVGNWQ